MISYFRSSHIPLDVGCSEVTIGEDFAEDFTDGLGIMVDVLTMVSLVAPSVWDTKGD